MRLTLFFRRNVKVLDIEKLAESNTEVLAKNVNGIQKRGAQQGFVLGQIQFGRLNHFFLRLPGTQFFRLSAMIRLISKFVRFDCPFFICIDKCT